MSTIERATTARTIEETVRRIHSEVISAGRLELFDELYAEDFVFTGREGTATREDVKRYLEGWRSAFSDLHSTVDHIVVQGNRAFWSDHYSGTNDAAWNGEPATGRTVTDIESMNEGTFNAAGQLLTHRMVTDEISERMQLGLLPPTPLLGTG